MMRKRAYRYPWTKDAADMMPEIVPGNTMKEIAAILSERTGRDFTPEQVKAYMHNHGLRNGRPRRRTYSDLFPKDAAEAMKEIVPGHSYREIQALMRERTGREYTVQQISAYIGNHGLGTGKTGRFEKGRAPANKGRRWSDYLSAESQAKCLENCFKKGEISGMAAKKWREVGSMRKNAEGYWIVKADDRPARTPAERQRRYRPAHSLIWERANGEIPAGRVVVFKDGDRDNLDIGNLALVSRGELAMLNSRGYLGTGSAALGEAGIAAVRLEKKCGEMKRGRRKAQDAHPGRPEAPQGA